MLRNLNTDKILIGEDGYLSIYYFNLSKHLSIDEKANDLQGQPAFYAPEIANYEEYDNRVDWWILGILIYEMLVGITPFFHKNR